MKVPRNNGIDADGVTETEADHFDKCPACGQWFDMRDLGEVLAHVHGADIEIGATGLSARDERLRRLAGRRSLGWGWSNLWSLRRRTGGSGSYAKFSVF